MSLLSVLRRCTSVLAFMVCVFWVMYVSAGDKEEPQWLCGVQASEDGEIPKSAMVLIGLKSRPEARKRQFQTLKTMSMNFQQATMYRGATQIDRSRGDAILTGDKIQAAYPWFYAATEEYLKSSASGIYVTPQFESKFAQLCQGRGFTIKAMPEDLKQMMCCIVRQGLLTPATLILEDSEAKVAFDTLYSWYQTKGDHYFFDLNTFPSESIDIMCRYMLAFPRVSGFMMLSVMYVLSDNPEACNLFKMSPQFFMLSTLIRRQDHKKLNDQGGFSNQLLRMNDRASDPTQIMPHNSGDIKRIYEAMLEREETCGGFCAEVADNLAGDLRLSDRDAQKRPHGIEKIDCERNICVLHMIHALREQRYLLTSVVKAIFEKSTHDTEEVRDKIKAFIEGPLQKYAATPVHASSVYLSLAMLIEFPELLIPVVELSHSVADHHSAYSDQCTQILVKYLASCRPLANSFHQDRTMPESRITLLVNAYSGLALVSNYITEAVFKEGGSVQGKQKEGAVKQSPLGAILNDKCNKWGIGPPQRAHLEFTLGSKLQQVDSSKLDVEGLTAVLQDEKCCANPELTAKLMFLAQDQWEKYLGGFAKTSENIRRKARKKR